MKVTIVSRIYRPEPSAASFFLGSVADALVARGDDVTVLTARPRRGQASGPTPENVRTFPVLRDANGYVRGYLPYLSFDVPLLFRLLFSPRADVVLVEPPPTTGVVVRLICGLRRMPYVYDAADIWSDAAGMATSSRVVTSLLRLLERFAMRGATRLVTISHGVVERVRALGVDRPIVVTGFGADTSAFTYEPAPTRPLLVYAGSYSTWHGAEIAVEALALLRDAGREVSLLVIGNGEQAALEARARELGIEGSVEFRPLAEPAALASTLRAATASLATLRPGTGYDYAFTSKAYSSLASGCPVVFAGPGPTGPFLDEAARTVRAGAAVRYDARAMADAIAGLLDSAPSPTERAELAKWTAQEHSMAAVAQRVADELALAAGRKRA